MEKTEIIKTISNIILDKGDRFENVQEASIAIYDLISTQPVVKQLSDEEIENHVAFNMKVENEQSVIYGMKAYRDLIKK